MSTARKILEKFRAKKPDEYKAQYAVNNALRDGKIVKPKQCQQCGKSGPVEAHHSSYSNPLNLRWLCRTCHLKIPQSNGAHSD